MQLQVNYQCDICSKSFSLNFEKAITEKKLECSSCGVVYNFSERDLIKFKDCYNELINKLKEAVRKEK